MDKMIRQMEMKDIKELIPLCQNHFDAVDMGGRFYSLDAMTASQSLQKFVKEPMFTSLVSENDGAIDGVCVFGTHKSMFDILDVHSSEILWYAKKPKTFIELFETIEPILEGNIHVGLPTKAEPVAKYLSKKGYIKTEIVYSKGGKHV